MASIDQTNVAAGTNLELPFGTELLSNQVAGHLFGKGKFGLLKHSKSGDILKPIYDKRSEREQEFYETLFNSANDHDTGLVALRQLVSRFNGLFYDTRLKINYIRLDNITALLPDASVLDIKIGSVTYDPNASEEKRLAETRKYAFAKDLGFRVLGMTIFDNKTKVQIKKERQYGLLLTPDDIPEALATFCQTNTAIVSQFQEQLIKIEQWFCKHNVDRWKFISSSLLFVYGHEKTIDESESQVEQLLKVIIKMIDFAHIFPNHGTDDNYVFGLRKLKHYLELARGQCLTQHSCQD